MNKTVKKILKITGITLGVILLLAIILPFVFKGKIIEKVKDEANKQLYAKVDFSEFGLSLFRSFPNFSLSVENFSVVGVNEFEGDTLASVKKLYATLDLMSVFSGDKINVKKIEIDEPRILLKTLKNGKVNWDIVKPTGTIDTTTGKPTEPSTFKMKLTKFSINNARLVYDDRLMNTYVEVNGLNHELSGDFTADQTNIKTETSVDDLILDYGGIRYLSKSNASIKANIDADLKNMKFTLKENENRLNDLSFRIDGFVKMLEQGYDLDMKFITDKTEFKSLLSMIPAIYSKDFDKLKTSGKLDLNAFVKGIYKDSMNMPAFGLTLNVSNAMFQYPSVPKAVTNINIKTEISSKGGTLDNTVVDVAKFHFEMAGNPFDLQLLIKTPMTDPEMNMIAKGRLDLSIVKDVYPLEKDQKLSGIFTADMTLKGKMSTIQNKQYEKFQALGTLMIQNFNYTSKDLTQPIDIQLAKLNFSPAYLDLADFNMKMGRNDFSAKGKIENYIPYWLKGETIHGTLSTSSNYMNINDLMPKTDASKEVKKDSVSKAMEAFVVPANVNFVMQCNFNKLIYDNLEMDNVNGVLEIKDQKVNMKNLSMNTLDGKMAINGYYHGPDAPANPAINMDFNVQNLNIQKAAKSFSMMQKVVPIAEKTSGNISTKFKLNMQLDRFMNPLYNTMTGGGSLNTSKIVIENVNTLNKVADALKMEKFKKLNLDKLNIAYEFADGRVKTKPFPIKLDKIKSTVSGSTGFDKSLDYLMKMEIPRSEFGGAANSVLNGLMAKANQKTGANISMGEMVKFDVNIGGSVTDPKVSTGLKEMKNDAVNTLKDQGKQLLDQKKEEALNKARDEAQKAVAEARKKRDQMIAEAQKQADNIRAEAQKAADKLTTEADAQGKKLISEAGSNIIKKKLAEKAAEKLNKEAANKAAALNSEANNKGNQLVSKATEEGNKLVAAAEEKAKL